MACIRLYKADLYLIFVDQSHLHSLNHLELYAGILPENTYPPELQLGATMEQNSVSDMNGDVVLADQILSYLSDKHEAGKEARKSGLSGQSQRTTSNNSKGKTERQRRKRAAQACECCRERKIRCDVIKHGSTFPATYVRMMCDTDKENL
jgi:hypothetical protein